MAQYRSYRDGELPDIQSFSVKELVGPLLPLVLVDAPLARTVFSWLFEALYKDSDTANGSDPKAAGKAAVGGAAGATRQRLSDALQRSESLVRDMLQRRNGGFWEWGSLPPFRSSSRHIHAAYFAHGTLDLFWLWRLSPLYVPPLCGGQC